MNLRAIPAMLAMIPSTLRGVGLDDLERIKTIARLAYPNVQHVSAEELVKTLSNRKALLVDVRSAEEFAVSQLEGAVNLRSLSEIAAALRASSANSAVLYCAVGFRSARLAHLLASRGFKNVMNLEGSIFQWANEGRPLFRGTDRVREVHPYGSRWGGLLKPGLAATANR